MKPGVRQGVRSGGRESVKAVGWGTPFTTKSTPSPEPRDRVHQRELPRLHLGDRAPQRSRKAARALAGEKYWGAPLCCELFHEPFLSFHN